MSRTHWLRASIRRRSRTRSHRWRGFRLQSGCGSFVVSFVIRPRRGSLLAAFPDAEPAFENAAFGTVAGRPRAVPVRRFEALVNRGSGMGEPVRAGKQRHAPADVIAVNGAAALVEHEVRAESDANHVAVVELVVRRLSEVD